MAAAPGLVDGAFAAMAWPFSFDDYLGAAYAEYLPDGVTGAAAGATKPLRVAAFKKLLASGRLANAAPFRLSPSDLFVLFKPLIANRRRLSAAFDGTDFNTAQSNMLGYTYNQLATILRWVNPDSVATTPAAFRFPEVHVIHSNGVTADANLDSLDDVAASNIVRPAQTFGSPRRIGVSSSAASDYGNPAGSVLNVTADANAQRFIYFETRVFDTPRTVDSFTLDPSEWWFIESSKLDDSMNMGSDVVLMNNSPGRWVASLGLPSITQLEEAIKLDPAAWARFVEFKLDSAVPPNITKLTFRDGFAVRSDVTVAAARRVRLTVPGRWNHQAMLLTGDRPITIADYSDSAVVGFERDADLARMANYLTTSVGVTGRSLLPTASFT